MIKNLNKKLQGKEPVTRDELFELVNSWGRKKYFFTKDKFQIEKCEANECYPLENLDA